MSEHEQADGPAIGKRLRERREQLKMTQSELSGKAGVGISSLSEFENGKREPTLSQLKKLADSLGTDVARFLAPEEARLDAVRWRERPADAELVEARFLKLCRQYRDLEQWAGEEEPVQLRKPARFPATRSEAAALARQVRGEMQLGDRPGLVLQRKLEDDYALKTFHLRVEPSGTAACTAAPEYGLAVLLNPLNSRARRTFDLAHELFHLLTWNVPVPPSAADMEESLADCFASALLLPDSALREAVERRIQNQRMSVANLCELARDFSVSIDALIWRLQNVYNWRDPVATRTLIDRARSVITPYRAFTADADEAASELPERYKALALQALRSGEISTGRFAEYMGLRRWEAMKFADEALGDEGISLPHI
jgi:XRE family transcriptional regulator, fatty acid utilization regulator